MKNVLLSAGMLYIVAYVVLILTTSSVALIFQRRFFLRPDEEQSFAIPGTVAIGTGVLFLWQVFTSGV